MTLRISWPNAAIWEQPRTWRKIMGAEAGAPLTHVPRATPAMESAKKRGSASKNVSDG